MKFTELTSELAANLKGKDVIVVYEAGDKTYFMGSVITNHGLSLDEALDLIGWDDETMTESVEKIGWDGYDYEAINVIWNPEEYLTEKGFLPKVKHWYFIEDCTYGKSEVYDEILKAETATEAFVEASRKWDALTESDRSKRDEVYIGYADTDEYGCVDYDTMTDIYWFKRDGSIVYYILDDYNGYGSEYPYCSDAVETAELLEGWNYSGDDPLTEFWHEASHSEIEYNGTYDGTTGASRPGKREEEED